jgi:hypothetical protein
MRCQAAPREQRRDAAVRVRHHADAEAARAQRRERVGAPASRRARDSRARARRELDRRSAARARDAGALEHGAEVDRHAIGVAVARTAGLRRARSISRRTDASPRASAASLIAWRAPRARAHERVVEPDQRPPRRTARRRRRARRLASASSGTAATRH